MNLDFFILESFNKIAGKNLLLDELGIFFAEYSGYFLVLVLLFFLMKNFKKYKKQVFVSFFSAFVSRFVVAEIIHHFYFRTRPFVENSVNLLISHKNTASFPSGHASFYFALSSVIYFFNKKLGTIFFFVSFLMGLARIYCGLHWPSDILAGALIGILVGWGSGKLFRRFEEKKLKVSAGGGI